MEEATRDKESSTSESEKNKQKVHGWIRIHSDEKTKPSPVDEPLEEESQARDRKIRRELDKP
jgi:hypothetical protein